MPNTEPLLQRIEALPPARIAEIEDFIAFIASRGHARQLIRAQARRVNGAFPQFGRTRRMICTMRSEGAVIAFGDIVRVPFPFTDQSQSKQRPAVVVIPSAVDP